jgi:hypothetical protein
MAADPRSAAAQPITELIGKWDIEYARGQRIENDVVTNIMAKGKITIVQSGDSLLATLESPPRPDGTPVPNATIGGRVSNGSAVFVQKQTVQLNMNGEMQSAQAVVTWTLKATGDALSGGIIRELPGMGPAGASVPVTGTRVKS